MQCSFILSYILLVSVSTIPLTSTFTLSPLIQPLRRIHGNKDGNKQNSSPPLSHYNNPYPNLYPHNNVNNNVNNNVFKATRPLYSSLSTPSPPPSVTLDDILTKLTSCFPLFVLLSAVLGYTSPSSLTWFSKYDNVITVALGGIMVGMGMTLTREDFKRVALNPTTVLFGVVCQFLFMPLSALSSSKLFSLPPSLFLGLTLVGCSPGGTASNLVSLIANADVALSVLMTAASTVLASVLTPTLTKLICGSVIKVNSMSLFLSTSKVVLLPVALGMWLNERFPKFSTSAARFTPFSSVVLVSLICGSVVASNASVISLSGPSLVKSVLLLHSLGFLLGYVAPRITGYPRKTCKTISIETGMQNSALAVVLANGLGVKEAAIPGAVSATVHSCLGSALASMWSV
eukprot:CAMPEP_0118638184 /NCGR_PEP_ID=MMETSP0785-20121206/3543_1 /TAXON_ID=91992 /ORGANISM="Bolidomonas pacifica, Strain CCMP 1866" /LENGTH=401 /DNA_ID=CAMNT_0006529405 /DNA_START=409 /DNA_END=1611 /DNA_ORIENTATION=+